ncbi:MAG TPA: ABC transporter ATP-binding protein [Alphaproteobacteria bacterium]|nr:ABC transporter ATP-binding protein [Alphaproteobacteria bacterium]
MSLLEVSGLSHGFGGVAAIDDLSFAVAEGEVLSVIGPNGAGKTTLFNLITGIYKPARGHILFAGREVGGLAPFALARLGIARTFQNLQIFLAMTAAENVMVGLHRHLDARMLPALFRLPWIARADRRAREEASGLLDFVGLSELGEATADELSYGALKRLEFARALATRPRLLLLDEPAAGLNASETQAIDALIAKVAKSGVTVLLVEHDMKLVMGVSHRILVLDYGRKLAEGSAVDVRSDPQVIAAYLGQAGSSLAQPPSAARRPPAAPPIDVSGEA